MLVWATEFPVKPPTDPEEILEICKVWLIGSPHSPWSDSSFGGGGDKAVREYTEAGRKVVIGGLASGGREWVGLQEHWVERSRQEWSTEVVGLLEDGECWISVRLNCNLLRPGLSLPKAKKPYVVRQLLDRLGGASDGEFSTSDLPRRLEERQVSLARKIVTGDVSNRLPIVYVSAGYHNEPSVDVDKLARGLGGVAHVVVEPSRHFSFALGAYVGEAAPYNGAVSVFWQGGGPRQVRLLPFQFRNSSDMESELLDAVRAALVSTRATQELTWNFLREQVSRTRLIELREAGSEELAEWMAAFDEESAAKDRRIEELQAETGRLNAELQRVLASSSTAGGGVLEPGKEKPLYPGEVQDTVLQALEWSRANLNSEGRRLHVVEDLLAANRQSGNEDDIAAEIKQCLDGKKDFTRKSLAPLELLGFEISEGGKHLKAVYRGDPRYTFTIPKSASDHRAGRNVARDITRTLFR